MRYFSKNFSYFIDHDRDYSYIPHYTAAKLITIPHYKNCHSTALGRQCLQELSIW